MIVFREVGGTFENSLKTEGRMGAHGAICCYDYIWFGFEMRRHSAQDVVQIFSRLNLSINNLSRRSQPRLQHRSRT